MNYFQGKIAMFSNIQGSLMQEFGGTSYYSYAGNGNDARVEICRQYGLDESFAQSLPTPENLMVVLSAECLNEINLIHVDFAQCEAGLVERKGFRKRNSTRLQRVEKLLSIKEPLLNNDGSGKRIYSQYLDDMLAVVTGTASEARKEKVEISFLKHFFPVISERVERHRKEQAASKKRKGLYVISGNKEPKSGGPTPK